jgi:predicted small metal-binding protein
MSAGTNDNPRIGRRMPADGDTTREGKGAMETFACKSLGIDCDFVVSAPSKEEVLAQAMQHGGTVHADLMKDMTEEQSAQFAQKLQEAIQPA